MGGASPRILIADDHDMLRRGIRTLIETRADLQLVAEAATGRQALDQARRMRPDIAILDYSLPQLNGLDLTNVLKREQPRIEILVYTMHDTYDVISDLLRAGVRGIVLKTEAERNLLSAIDALIARRPYFSGSLSEVVLHHFAGKGGSRASTSLTQREREVVQLIAEGRINKEISHILDISMKTVETHRASLMHKLKLRTTADLVRYAIRNNIVQP